MSASRPLVQVLRGLVVVAALGAVGWLAWAEHRAANPVAPAEPVETDPELVPYEESFGEESGLDDEPFFLPSTKGTIGIGGGSRGAFKNRGGGEDLEGGAETPEVPQDER